MIAKEVGSGISGRLAKRLWEAGVRIIDVAGAGGTSWAAVEAGRAPNDRLRAIAETFRDWGIPTARAVADVRAACPQAVVIASGGIRTGLDAAKAVRLGADLAAQAAGVLPAALESVDAVDGAFRGPDRGAQDCVLLHRQPDTGRSAAGAAPALRNRRC